MPIKRLKGLGLAFGCFNAMINSFGYIGFSLFSRGSSGYIPKALLANNFGHTVFWVCCFGVGSYWFGITQIMWVTG